MSHDVRRSPGHADVPFAVVRRPLVRLAVAVALAAPSLARADAWDELVEAVTFAETRTAQTVARLAPGVSYPHSTRRRGEDADPNDALPPGDWRFSGPRGHWTNGHWAGVLWQLHELTGNPVWRTHALAATSPLEAKADDRSDHDVGFLLMLSFGERWRQDGDPAAAAVLARGAASLSSHWIENAGILWSFNFNSRGIRSQQNAIIDSMMNMELPFVAARLSGNAEWDFRARSHVGRLLADHVRPDGSTRQVVNYTAATGEPELPGIRWQGYSADSSWSRGTGWAIRGLTIAARETGVAADLEATRRIADFWRRTAPADDVPYWDFIAPELSAADLEARYAPNGIGTVDPLDRDTSAAALLAVALMDLAVLEATPERRLAAFDRGERLLLTLSRHYLARGPGDVEAILAQGTDTFPGSQRGLVYGDYYFLEALRLYRDLVRPPLAFAAGPAGTLEAWIGGEPGRWRVVLEEGDRRLRAERRFAEDLSGTTPLAPLWYAARPGATGSLSFRVRAEENFASSAAPAVEIHLAAAIDGSGVVARLARTAERSGLFARSADGTETVLATASGPLLADAGWKTVGLSWSGGTLSLALGGTTVATASSGAPPAALALGGNGRLLFDDLSVTGFGDAIAADPRDAWRTARFGDARSPRAADDADPDGDGRPNLLEYALGADPQASDGDGLDAEPVAGGVRLRLARPLAAGVAATVERLGPDGRWLAAGTVAPGATSVDVPGDASSTVVRLRLAVPDALERILAQP